MFDDLLKFLSELPQSWVAITSVYVGGVLALSLVAYLLISRIEKVLVSRGHWPAHYSFVSKFFFAIEVFVVSLTLSFVPGVVRVPADVLPYLRGFTRAGIIVSASVLLLKAIDAATSAYLRGLSLSKADNLRERRIATKIRYVEKIIDVLIIVVAIALFLMGFPSFRRLGGSILASAGLASIIVGLAAQRSLGTLIAGLQVAFTQPIRIGDAVLVENEWGEIEEINLTYVIVRIWDLRRLVVPIQYFLEKPFQNWTRTSADLLGVVMLYLDYSVPLAPLREELTRVLRTSALWDGKVNIIQVVECTERTLQIRCLVSARSSPQAFDLRCEVREALITFVQKNYPGALPQVRLQGAGGLVAGAGSGAGAGAGSGAGAGAGAAGPA